MEHAELLLLLQIAVVILVVWAGKLRVSYPVFLVLGGLVLSCIPGISSPQLDPKIVFLLFLPPILHYAALLTDWRAFRANLGAISSLAIALVLFTTTLVAAVAHYWIGVPWPIGFILGAIISPPDSIAATAVIATLRLPTSLGTIIEGESLVNDATALIVYQFAVIAVIQGHFSFPAAIGSFAVSGGGGILLGLVLGVISLWARLTVQGSPVSIMVMIVSPFCVYVIAELVHVSSVLATVTTGLFVTQMGLTRLPSATRIQVRAIWDALVFFINGFAFILIGLQLPHVAAGLHASGRLGILTLQAAVICFAVIAARFLFILPGYGLIRVWRHHLHPTQPPAALGWRGAILVSWAGMRGIVSLAAALAIPLALDEHTTFPYRQELIFVSFFVIVATLVLQGLSLPMFIHHLHLETDGDDLAEEARAQLAMADTALKELDLIDQQEKLPDYFEAYLRQRYFELQESARHDAGERPADHFAYPGRIRIWQRLLEAERRQLLHLRNTAQISDTVFRRLLTRLDYREATL
jgi:CPA1 family monovalent cation:H+ antiporter